VEIEYEVIGEGQPLLMVQGFAGQLVMWDDELCAAFVDRGFQVIRYDHRDIGKSTYFDDLGIPDIVGSLVRAYTKRPVSAPYTLYDMADDGIGILDHLGIDRAHVFGCSMGGMVAQCMAIRHPARLKSVTSVMSTTGARWASIPRPRALRAMLKRPPRDAQGAARQLVDFFRVVRGPRFAFDEDRLFELGKRVHSRAFHPQGAARHLAAIAATGDRTPGLKKVELPFLVIHGTHDPLVPVLGGVATHRAVKGSRLKLIQGMGHELPSGAWPMITGAVARHAGL
jgi:pimeloyl-ACP methyl ester carboxylesterase